MPYNRIYRDERVPFRRSRPPESRNALQHMKNGLDELQTAYNVLDGIKEPGWDYTTDSLGGLLSDLQELLHEARGY